MLRGVQAHHCCFVQHAGMPDGLCLLGVELVRRHVRRGDADPNGDLPTNPERHRHGRVGLFLHGKTGDHSSMQHRCLSSSACDHNIFANVWHVGYMQCELRTRWLSDTRRNMQGFGWRDLRTVHVQLRFGHFDLLMPWLVSIV